MRVISTKNWETWLLKTGKPQREREQCSLSYRIYATGLIARVVQPKWFTVYQRHICSATIDSEEQFELQSGERRELPSLPSMSRRANKPHKMCLYHLIEHKRTEIRWKNVRTLNHN